MNRPFAFMAAVISASLSSASLAAEPMSSLRIAAVHNGAVCASVDGGALRCFGQASSKARLPVWSRDGTKIAFVDDADPAVALAWLVVLDQHGQPLSRLPIKPLAAGEVQGGMRFVDGAPHFTAAAARAPVLRLDGRPVLSGLPADPGALGPVRWSADGSRFAFMARDAAGGHRVVLGDAPGSAAYWVDLPASKSEAPTLPALFWSGQDLHVQRLVPARQQGAAVDGRGAAPGARQQLLEDLVLVGPTGGRRWKHMAEPAFNPLRAAEAFRSEALRHSLLPGAQDADVWCKACALDPMTRRRSGGGSD